MRNIALFIVVFCVHACLFAQNKAATYMVKDSLTQVAVRSCRVMFDNKTTERTTVTDDTGCFNSPVGATTVTISHVAYEPKQVDLRKLNGNTIYIVLPYKPNISLIHSILYNKLFAYICKFLYLYNIILADIYA